MSTNKKSCCRCKCPKNPITLYYRINQSPSDTDGNASTTIFVTDPLAPTIYRGIENRYMTDSNFVTYNKNIITFAGSRTPTNTDLPQNMRVPDMYNETIDINMYPLYGDNYIQATANYIDTGKDFATTLPYVDYKVSIASGIFKGYKNLRINFYNKGDPPGYTNLGPVRIITIT